MTLTEYKRKLNKDIKIITKVDPNDFPYEAFINVPKKLKLTKKDKGNKVWIASYPRTTKAFLFKILEDGNISVKFKGEVPIRTFYKDEVIIHPSLWTKERLNFKVEIKTKFAV